MLIQEILVQSPWLQKKGSPERGAVWTSIANTLNQIDFPNFNVDQHSVCDHYNLLERKCIKKRNEEERATGISPDEETDVEKGIADII